ncbi:hypothetical protein [Kitasatospora cheerisanensis]|uniref:Uncharacterized protein n=1 Tax=Kitasatospora cheerisanensis KCTC 2395 TaxID=1348663 RepID=A0A066Z222_9ACTN|nr:hypothetical protein [Kitasatospora cheerisanensis]KDN84401.1 hypothetical protein KCH_41920 [Kitasatospora cheerisanensis KCTC 2395]
MTICLACEQQTTGKYLCARCTTRLDGQLSLMPALYDALEAHLRPSSQVSTAVGSGCPRPDAPLPVAEPALDMRGPGGMVTVLETWRQAVHEDAGQHWPSPFGDYRGRVRRASAGLRGLLPYITREWQQAGTFAEEIRDLHASARSIIAPQERPLRAGTCTWTDEAGEVCGAVLLATPGRPVVCRWCRASYPASSWLDLAAEVAKAA